MTIRLKQLWPFLAVLLGIWLMVLALFACSDRIIPEPLAGAPGASAGNQLHVMNLTGTANASGTVTIAGDYVLGKLYAVAWDTGTFSTTTGMAITLSVQGPIIHNIMTVVSPTTNSDAVWYPREAQHTSAGAAVTSTTVSQWELPLLNGPVQLLVTGAGDSTSGTMRLYWED